MLEAYRYVEPSNPVLRRIAEAIPLDQIMGEDTQLLIDRMFEIAYPEQGNKNKPLLVGLAAPQIGVSKRLILVDVIADGKGKTGDLQAFVNPIILQRSEETQEGYEGCRSTDRVCGIVERARDIKITAYTSEGEEMERIFSGFPAVVFQHEIDHLDGRVFVDRVKREEDLHWVEREEFPEYRKHWKNWPHKISRKDWEIIQRK